MTPERELAEIKSKLEEFRAELRINPEGKHWDAWALAQLIRDKFDLWLPPPKKGCWGFFRDYRKEPYRKEPELTGRMFESCEDEDHANRVRDCFDHCNPGPVFFLEEK